MAPFLRRLWVAMLTRDEEISGTDSQIALTVKEDRADRLYHLFPDTSQNDQERGQPNLYEVPEELVLSAKIDPGRISPDRMIFTGVDIRGDDAWQPERFFVWGERLGDGAIIPLALNLEPDFSPGSELRRVTLSTGQNHQTSVALTRINLGTAQTRIESLLLAINTSSEEDSGTNDSLELSVRTGPATLRAKIPFPPDTSQEDLETGLPNLYESRVGTPGPLFPPFTRAELRPNSIRLKIEGDDVWLPSSFFMFGVDTHSFADRSVREVVPLVHLPEWNLGPLSTDLNEGRPEVVLPLVPLLPLHPPPGPPPGVVAPEPSGVFS
jgi:hypothetical protein